MASQCSWEHVSHQLVTHQVTRLVLQWPQCSWEHVTHPLLGAERGPVLSGLFEMTALFFLLFLFLLRLTYVCSQAAYDILAGSHLPVAHGEEPFLLAHNTM